MTAKLKKMGYILCIGAVLVFIGSIGIYNSGTGLMDIWKTILMTVLAIFLGILSVVCKKSFGLEKFDDFVLGTSFATLVCAFASIGSFELFGEWYSFGGDGCHIFLASVFILIGILSVIMHIKNKVYAFIEMAFVCLIISTYLVIYHFTKSNGIAFIISNLFLLGANVYSLTNKRFSVFTIFTYFAILFNLALLDSDFEYSALLFNIISFVSLIVIQRKYKNTYTNIAPLIFGLINMIILSASIAQIDISAEVELLLFVLVAAVYDLAVVGLKLNTLKGTAIIHKIFMTLIYFITLCGSFDNELILALIPTLILTTSVIQAFVFNNDEEKYFVIYKAFALALWIIMYVFNVLNCENYFIAYCTLNALVLAAYSLIRIKHVRINALVLLVLTLLFMLFDDNVSILAFVIGLVLVAVDYAVVFLLDNKDSNSSLARTFFIVSLFYTLLLVIKVDLDNFKFLIAAVFYFVLYVLSGKDKLKAGFSVGFIIGSLLLYTYSIQDSPKVLQNLVLFGGVFAFAYTIIETNTSRAMFINIATSILLIFGLLFGLLPNDINASIYSMNMPLIVVVLLESVAMLLYSIITNNKYLFYSSLIYTVIAIIELLVSIDGIPTAVVITISGIIVITVVLVMIKKYMADEHDKDLQAERERKEFLENSFFCGTCGNRVHKDAVYCGKCGKLIKSEVNFCGQCGTKLRASSKKCPKCGDIVNR